MMGREEGSPTPLWTPDRPTEVGEDEVLGVAEGGEEEEEEPHRAPEAPAGREVEVEEEEPGQNAYPAYIHSTLAFSECDCLGKQSSYLSSPAIAGLRCWLL